MKQIVERLSMLTAMRDEMKEQILAMGEVDCASPAFRALDDAIKCLDMHHISRLRVSLDVGHEVPLLQWITALADGKPLLTRTQATELLMRAIKKCPDPQVALDFQSGDVVVEEVES